MSQCCGKIPTEEDAGYIALVVLNTVQRYGNIWQGDLGEQMATEHAVKELNLGTERFDKKSLLALGILVDKYQKMNYSKKRINTSETLRAFFAEGPRND